MLHWNTMLKESLVNTDIYYWHFDEATTIIYYELINQYTVIPRLTSDPANEFFC